MKKKVYVVAVSFLLLLSIGFSTVFAASPVSQEVVQDEKIFMEISDLPINFDEPELVLQSGGTGGSSGGTTVTARETVCVAGDFEPSDWCYGREILANSPGGSWLVSIYDRLNETVANFDSEVDVSDLDLVDTPDDEYILYKVWMAIHGDHPEYFWLDPITQNFDYAYMESTGAITTIYPFYLLNPDEPEDRETLSQQKALVERTADAWIEESGLQTSDDFYAKTKKIHDLICNKVSYDYSEKPDITKHTIYDTLVQKLAVCDGYVTTYQYLLSKVGVHTHFIGGKSFNPSKLTEEQHAWNMIQNGDKYYFSDITWDDQEDVIFYDYFNRTSEFMEEADHIIYMPYDIPLADDDSQSYYAQEENKNICIKSVEDIPTAIQSVIDCLKKGDSFARLYFDVPIDEVDWYWWLFRNGGKADGSGDGVRTIAKAFDIKGVFSSGHRYIWKEFHFLVFPSLATTQARLDGKIETLLCVTCPGGKYLLSTAYYKVAGKIPLLNGYISNQPAFSMLGTKLYKLPTAESLPSGTTQVKFMLWDNFNAITPLFEPITVPVIVS